MSEPKIIQTRTGMSVQIMPRQAEIPPADPKAIQLQHIAYYDRPYTSYEGKEITEEVIAKVLEQIPKGLNIYLSLIPYGLLEPPICRCGGMGSRGKRWAVAD